jgi:hypothetical protein
MKHYSHENELRDPWNYISREFLEELLIVRGKVPSGTTLPLRRFEFRSGVVPPLVEAHAEEFDKEHRKRRETEDGVVIDIESAASPPIRMREQKTGCAVKVVSDSQEPPTTKDVLVCFSLLDLGIEVVKVFRYTIQRQDTMLDGEILVDNVGRLRELVRMPIALFSVDYLERAFGCDDRWQNYKLGLEPSIIVPKAPDRNEIMVFPWDPKVRIDIVKGIRKGSAWQQERYLTWYEMFGEHFVDDSGNGPDEEGRLPRDVRPSRLFVPGTAKILNLYFSLKRSLRT